MVAHSANAIVGVDLDGTIVSVNPAAERFHGQPATRLAGQTLAVWLPELAAEIAPTLARIRAGERPADIELARNSDGRRGHVSVTFAAIRDARGRPCGASAITRDVTDRKEAESWLAAAVTRVLAEADALDDPLQHVLAALGERLGWEVVNFWAIDASAGVARCASTWTARENGAREFVELSRQREFVPGQATPGRVWASGTPAWVEDFGGQDACVRGQAAAASGLRGAVGIPIVSGGEVLGVMECLASQGLCANERLTELMATLSLQIGQFLERRRVEDEHARKLEAVAHTRELAGSTARGARTAICEVAVKVSDAHRTVVYEPDPDGSGLTLTGAAGAAAPDELCSWPRRRRSPSSASTSCRASSRSPAPTSSPGWRTDARGTSASSASLRAPAPSRRRCAWR